MRDLRSVFLGLALAACGGRYVTDGSTPQGGGSGGSSMSKPDPSSACLNSGEPQPASPLTFSFESHQALYINSNCDGEYTLTKLCNDETVPIVTEGICSQACDLKNNGGRMHEGCLLQVGQYKPDGPNVTTSWDGYQYTAGTSSAGCTCFKGMPATTGTYAIAVTAYAYGGDAFARTNGFAFTTSFEYPPPDGIVHVPLEVTGP